MFTFKLYIDVVKTINTTKQRIFIFLNYKNNQSIGIDDRNVQSI